MCCVFVDKITYFIAHSMPEHSNSYDKISVFAMHVSSASLTAKQPVSQLSKHTNQ